jgi:hypothetical protein
VAYTLGKLFTSGEGFSQRTRGIYIPLEGEQVYFVPDAVSQDESFEPLAAEEAQGAGKGTFGLLVLGTVALFGWLAVQLLKKAPSAG